MDFIFPQTFCKLAESRPAKTDKMSLYNIPLWVYTYPCMTMAIQRGNVSSRAEYYVFRKFLVRDMQQFDVMTVVGNCATMATHSFRPAIPCCAAATTSTSPRRSRCFPTS